MLLLLLLSSLSYRTHHASIGILLLLVPVAQAACIVKDNKGTPIALNNLPKGMRYVAGDTASDNEQLHCHELSSCKGYTISNCSAVWCTGAFACSEARLMDNTMVRCTNARSCRKSSINPSFQVLCGDNHIDACALSIIAADGIIWCKGEFACSSSRGEEIIFQVGQKGRVQCSEGNGYFACKNMIVHVNHGHRACFGSDLEDVGRCAVMCVEKSDCDRDSIRFVVGN
ncbi:hypothetical protein ACA910_011220 [Epithemia clementina (nom. ined.)]